MQDLIVTREDLLTKIREGIYPIEIMEDLREGLLREMSKDILPIEMREDHLTIEGLPREGFFLIETREDRMIREDLPREGIFPIKIKIREDLMTRGDLLREMREDIFPIEIKEEVTEDFLLKGGLLINEHLLKGTIEDFLLIEGLLLISEDLWLIRKDLQEGLLLTISEDLLIEDHLLPREDLRAKREGLQSALHKVEQKTAKQLRNHHQKGGSLEIPLHPAEITAQRVVQMTGLKQGLPELNQGLRGQVSRVARVTIK